ncbi:MAG: carboxypeptidase-like regulatory domain-containing protein [Terracidiphilus sp.]
MLLPALLAAQAAPGSLAASTPATVHGVVTNAATGQPLPRALVRIEGNAEAGALTDGDGRFEIPGVPTGPQAFQVLKPGFRDRPLAEDPEMAGGTVGPAHNILVAAEMPDLSFTLAPTSSIRGQVELSTGDPAEGIAINLLKRTVVDGRADWTLASTTKTNSEGAYRFAGLSDGSYVMYTEPSMENGPAATLSAGAGHAGYASIFYPDARDLAGAARIQLSQGEQAQANFTLTLEPFQTVSIAVGSPQAQTSASSQTGDSFTAVIMDAAGHQLPYQALYAPQAHTLQALLPDGNYSLLVASQPTFRFDGSGQESAQGKNAGPLVGTVDLSVAGHEILNLRVPLSAAHHNPVQLSIVRTALSPAQTGSSQGGAGQTMVMLSPAAGWMGQGMVNPYAGGAQPGPMEAAYLAPGSYWAHTNIGLKGICEQSFTAGGASLAREPVVIGLTGSVAPMTLTLRDDCARLTLTLPQSLMTMAPGEEPFYTVYVVPDFDSTVDLSPATLRPSTGGSVTLEDLTPGEYHVYMFPASAQLEYRNPAVLAAVADRGQAVTLSPETTSSLVLEGPER